MSTYWKQALWIGGIYWLLAFILKLFQIPQFYVMDMTIVFLLTLFLIPLKFLKPFKLIDNAINKLPKFSTFIISIGWMPYISAIYAILMMIGTALIIKYTTIPAQVLVYDALVIANIFELVCAMMLILAVLSAGFTIFIMHKSIAGCLDKKYRLIADTSCELPTLDASAKDTAKNLYKTKRSTTKKTSTSTKSAVTPKKIKAPRKPSQPKAKKA